ncbi:hypothetical protein WA588_005924, partial [Blastocystis sp. NMH]
MKLKLVNGLRDGEALIVNDGVPYLKLTYKNGVMTGNVERLNKYLITELKGSVVNGDERGLFEEYDRNKKVVWRGYYRNGRRYSEVVKGRRGGRWYEERSVENRKLLSIAEYDEGLHDKNGRCMEYENGEWIGEWMYESGMKGRCVREYHNGKLQLYDASGKMTYEGSFAKEDVKDGFYGHEPMEGMSGYCKEVNSNGVLISVSEYEPLRMKKNGKCFEMENGRVKRVCLYEMDQMVRVMMEFSGSAMIENDEKGKKVYEGGFKGDMKNGFVREGKGKEYGVVFATNRNESMTLIGTWKNGKKNGEFFEVDMNGTVKRKCLYVNDELNRVMQEFSGNTMIEYGSNGKRIYKGGFAGNVKSGFKRNGDGKEFDVDGETALYSGDWKNGKRDGMGTEMKGLKSVYTGEWKNGMRNGKGEEMDESGRVVYEGEWWNGKRNGMGEVLKGTRWMGHWKDGKMNGMGYEKDGNGVMKRGCLFENGEMKRVVQEFDGGKMVEYDENGKKVYEGEYKGNVEKGFVREGFGKEYRMVEEKITSRAEPTIEIEKKRFCCWVREIEHEVAGVELVTKKYREEVVEGYWKDGVYQVTVVPSSLTSNSLSIEELRIGDNGYNDDSVTELKLSWLVRLKRIVIGDECFGKVRVFELDGLSELESVVIGEYSFRIGVYERSDGSYRIVNCSKLKSIQIGYRSCEDYHSFELNNLLSLQSIDIGRECFEYAPSFSLTDLPQLQSVKLGMCAFEYVHSIVFENLPKLQSIQLEYGALRGDGSSDRWTISNPPYNFKNTLTMRNLPSLTEFKGHGNNFECIGSVILENIPQLSSSGIQFGNGGFYFTYSLQSS